MTDIAIIPLELLVVEHERLPRLLPPFHFPLGGLQCKTICRHLKQRSAISIHVLIYLPNKVCHSFQSSIDKNPLLLKLKLLKIMIRRINQLGRLLLESAVVTLSSTDTKTAPSGSFLCLMMIFLRNASGDGINVSFLSIGIVNSIEPKTSSKIFAIFLCCGREQ